MEHSCKGKSSGVMLALAATLLPLALKGQERPNVVIILADDIGYGDLSPYFPSEGYRRLEMPHIERLAREGQVFTNAHAAAATSTPSRYALLTGHYPWRRKDTGVAPGDAALIIKPGEEYTLAQLFREAGYETAAVGKWHLGLGRERGGQDWNAEVAPGPRELGFGYSYIMAATADRTPCVFMENQRVVGLDPKDPIYVSYKKNFEGEPSGKTHPELLTKQRPSHGHAQAIVNGISRIGFMKGGEAARWVDENIADSITHHAIQFIARASQEQKPFFLYFATNDIHVPRQPHPRFQRKSGMGLRGDALLEFDDSVGAILRSLEEQGILENTIVILTSDNGPVVDDGYQDEAVALLGNHKPWGPYRGGKYSAYEAGTRVPFIVYNPYARARGGENDALLSHIDLLKSFGQLLGRAEDERYPRDGEDLSDVLFQNATEGRRQLVLGSYTLSLLTSDGWRYIEPQEGRAYWPTTNTETGLSLRPQLYNIKEDPTEYRNLVEVYPEKYQELKSKLEMIRQYGEAR